MWRLSSILYDFFSKRIIKTEVPFCGHNVSLSCHHSANINQRVITMVTRIGRFSRIVFLNISRVGVSNTHLLLSLCNNSYCRLSRNNRYDMLIHFAYHNILLLMLKRLGNLLLGQLTSAHSDHINQPQAVSRTFIYLIR